MSIESELRHPEPRTSSDHNVIGLELSWKDIKMGGNNVLKRSWKDFYDKECLNEFRRTDWSDILQEFDVNVANSLLEERICGIVDKFATLKIIQSITKYNNWISRETKKEMDARDRVGTNALNTNLDENWMEFRRLRNLCTSLQKKDKKKYLDDMYKGLKMKIYTASLFDTTRTLLGLEPVWTNNLLQTGWKSYKRPAGNSRHSG